MTLGFAGRRALSIALGLLFLAFLYGCQAEEQGEARSSETTEDTSQTGDGDSSEAQGVVNAISYVWPYLEVCVAARNLASLESDSGGFVQVEVSLSRGQSSSLRHA